MKSSASESKPFQSRSKGETPGLDRRKKRLHEQFQIETGVPIIDSDAELFMHLFTIQCIGLAHEKFRV